MASMSRSKAGDGEAGEGDGWETIGGSMLGRRRGRSALFSNRRNFGGVAGLVSASEGKRGGVSALWPVQLVFVFSQRYLFFGCSVAAVCLVPESARRLK